MATPITWNEANFNWDNNPHTWDEVLLVIEVGKALGGGGVMEEDMPWMKSQDTKKRLIKLICKVQGKTIKEEKKIQDYKPGFKPSRFPYTWNDVALVEEVIEVIQQGGGGVIEDDMPWMRDEEKKKRLVKLICKVQGRTYKETKKTQNIKITAKDIKLLAEKVLGIEVITENIKF